MLTSLELKTQSEQAHRQMNMPEIYINKHFSILGFLYGKMKVYLIEVLIINIVVIPIYLFKCYTWSQCEILKTWKSIIYPHNSKRNLRTYLPTFASNGKVMKIILGFHILYAGIINLSHFCLEAYIINWVFQMLHVYQEWHYDEFFGFCPFLPLFAG